MIFKRKSYLIGILCFVSVISGCGSTPSVKEQLVKKAKDLIDTMSLAELRLPSGSCDESQMRSIKENAKKGQDALVAMFEKLGKKDLASLRREIKDNKKCLQSLTGKRKQLHEVTIKIAECILQENEK